MLRIGCHLSSSKGYLAMGKEAVKIGANTFQFFTRNPRGGKAKELDISDIEAYLEFAQENGIARILAHAPYTLNACAKDPDLRQFAYDTMCDDLRRLQYIPEAMYNFHPGSHVKQGVEQGIFYICDLLNRIHAQSGQTTVLLETMAGKGTELGRNFEELSMIIDRVEDKSRLGVCLDTCHVFDGGYDIVHSLDKVLEEFDQTIGLHRLKAVHLNDSKHGLDSHKDRHEKIGEGQIGLETFVKIVTHPKLRELPFYLETPNDLAGYQREIALLREKAEGERI
ncbi:deoxyribonuclease IV [Lachnospiraceae bacterium]|nr:deoxyribonuclease IV [Lachnospiraceae bacterium]